MTVTKRERDNALTDLLNLADGSGTASLSAADFRAVRNAVGMSISQCAEAIGAPPTMVQEFENGTRKPDPKSLVGSGYLRFQQAALEALLAARQAR